MQIVIDIPEEIYSYVNTQWRDIPKNDSPISIMCSAIINGTPLPEGHGRLIDIDAAYHTLRQYVSFDDLDEVMSNLNCVLEADKEGQDETDSD